MDQHQGFVLASSSERRVSLLKQIGFSPEMIVHPDIDESSQKNEIPKSYSLRMAISKAQKVADICPGRFVLSADTVACTGRVILPKTETLEEAKKSLLRISGRRHRVYTSLCLILPDSTMRVKSVMTVVQFKRLSISEMKFYLDSNQWVGKAAGCDIQGLSQAFIKYIRGSYSNVVGLPLHETYCILSQIFKV